jgi:hypothetical protein
MCAPILLTGLQVATSLAGGLAQQSEANYQAKLAQIQAQHQARVAAANAEFKRYEAERQSAAERARQSTSGVDPKSESVIRTLSQSHADRTVGVLDEEHKARLALYQGAVQSRYLKRAAQSALTRSILSSTGILANGLFGGSAIYIPE